MVSRALEVNGKLRRGERPLGAVRKMGRSACGRSLEVGGKLLGRRAGGTGSGHRAARLCGGDHERRAGHGHPYRSRGGATRGGGPMPLLPCMGWRVSTPRRVHGRHLGPGALPGPRAVRRGANPSVGKARGLRDAWRARNAQSSLAGPMRTARHGALVSRHKLLLRLLALVRLLPLLPLVRMRPLVRLLPLLPLVRMHLTRRSCRHAGGALGRRMEEGARQLRVQWGALCSEELPQQLLLLLIHLKQSSYLWAPHQA